MRDLSRGPMYRPISHILYAAIVLVCAATGAAGQQPDDARRMVEYLERHGLQEVEAADLRYRLQQATPDQRGPLAMRLSELYVRMLAQASTTEQRQRIEELGKRLVRQVPAEEAGDLRLALVRARYQWAKGIAEHARLHVVDPGDLQEAERTLRDAVPELSSVAQSANETIQRLERRRINVGLDAAEEQAFQTAARVRSTAHYLMGWARYYLSITTGGPRFASDALIDLGVLLGSEPNRPANIERADQRLMRYDHVADSAIASAFCESRLGNTDTALRWLEKIEGASELSEAIRARLFISRLLVLGEGRRWRDLAYHSDLQRRARRADGKPGLEPAESHLLAHIAWGALGEARLPPRDRTVLEEIAHGAIQDLVRQGQVAILRSLVERFGTATLEGDGFVFAYVRGQNAYERANRAYEQAGYDSGQVAQDDAVANLFADAVRALDTALTATDAPRYPVERAQAMQLAAMASYLGGALLDAADRFEKAHQNAEDTALAERALWHAIIALDAAIRDGQTQDQARRERLSTLYLQSYPGSERAARLLVARAGAASADNSQAIEILLQVEPQSPLYEAARRRAERLLYERVRELTGDARSAVALRYLTVAEELLVMDRRRVMTGERQAADEAAGRAMALARAMLQVLLGSPVPDADRADALLEIVQELRLRVGAAPRAIESEIAYRRVQLALVRGQVEEARRLAEHMDADDEPFRALASRALYAHAARAFFEQPEDLDHARRVVAFGGPVIAELGSDPQRLATPQVFGVHTTVARAAWLLAIQPDETGSDMLDLVLAIDGRLVAADLADAATLARFGYACERAARPGEALDAWRRLLAGAADGSSMSLRARYESARLLAREDTVRAIDALRQHQLLYPDTPEPWAGLMRDLLKAIETGGTLPGPAMGVAP